MEKLTLQIAKKLIEGAEEKAKQENLKMVISIVDEGGNLIALHRMDDAWIASIDIAQNKAWTSVALKMPTEQLAATTVPGSSLYGLNTTNNGKLVVFGGGIPLVRNGVVIGAVGVSGDSVENDIVVAKAAAQTFENLESLV